MRPVRQTARRSVRPLIVFAAVVAIHFLWHGIVPEQDPAQSRWATADIAQREWLTRYIEAGDYWLGTAYALPIAFAAVALRRYREGRFCAARRFAVGGVTFSGVLSVAGCYLVGCCGSPMLAVYLSLLGAAFLPFAKPLIALITLMSVLIGWWWMNRHRPLEPAHSDADPSSATCSCANEAEAVTASGSVFLKS